MSRNDKARLRRRTIGYVFQDFNLLAGLTALENVSLPSSSTASRPERPRPRAWPRSRTSGSPSVRATSPTSSREENANESRSPAPIVGDRHLLLADEPSGALGFLGALLGVVGGYVGMIGWLRSNSLNGGIAALGNIPVADLLLILLGMPAFAAAVGWLFAGREPEAMTHQAIE